MIQSRRRLAFMRVRSHDTLSNRQSTMQMSHLPFPLNVSSLLRPRVSSGMACTAVAVLLTLGMTVGLGVNVAAAQSASPQAAEHDYTDHWRAHYDRQTARMLRERPWSRASQIQSVIDVTGEVDRLSLAETADALLTIIERDSTAEHRQLAVQALRKMGTEHLGAKQYEQAMDRLYSLMQEEPSRDVRKAAARALAPYIRRGEASTR